VLFRAALNLAINRRRRLKFWRFVSLETVEQETSDGKGYERTMPRHIREAVDALPDRYRSVLLLTEVAGMNYGEVAGTLGIGEGTVGSRRSRALALLRKALGIDATDEAEVAPVAMKLEKGELL
jgi:RNA polymerase sigma factor (sigma-70 family)